MRAVPLAVASTKCAAYRDVERFPAAIAHNNDTLRATNLGVPHEGNEILRADDVLASEGNNHVALLYASLVGRLADADADDLRPARPGRRVLYPHPDEANLRTIVIGETVTVEPVAICVVIVKEPERGHDACVSIDVVLDVRHVALQCRNLVRHIACHSKPRRAKYRPDDSKCEEQRVVPLIGAVWLLCLCAAIMCGMTAPTATIRAGFWRSSITSCSMRCFRRFCCRIATLTRIVPASAPSVAVLSLCVAFWRLGSVIVGGYTMFRFRCLWNALSGFYALPSILSGVVGIF